jgi:hypothetical protein
VFGTGAAAHAAGSIVYSIGSSTILPSEYQDQIKFGNFLANGSTTTFAAEGVSIYDSTQDSTIDSTIFNADHAVMVYVGGVLQTTGYTVTNLDPVTVVFDVAPPNGYQVSIRVRQGLSWYQPGVDTASNGDPLQITNTIAARFIRGDT